MGCYDRSKNKLKACALCLLLCAANLIEVSEARKVGGRVTKPTANRGYASPDIAKLSYSPSHQAAPPKSVAPVASAPSQQAGRPPVGWNVPNNAPPPYSANAGNHGPPPPYSAQANPNLNSRFNEPPPPYSGNPGFQPAPAYQGGAPAFGASSGVVAGNAYRSHGHNISSGGFGGGFPPVQPNAGYPVQPVQGFPGAPVAHPGGGYPGGYPQQPVYQSPAGGFQQPGTVIHHYEQPQTSGGSGIGTILGAGAAGLAAGVGGAALYDALKPKEEPKEAAPPAETTTTTTLAPINPNGDAPLAPLPANPNGEAPLAPLPETPTPETPLATTPPAETTTANATLDPVVPLAAFPENSSTGTSSETSAVTPEAPSAALSVQPNLAAAGPPTTAPQLSEEPSSVAGKASGMAPLSSFLLLLPALCKFLLA